MTPTPRSPPTDRTEEDTSSPTSIFATLDTGDVFLYRTNDIGATFNAWVQGSRYSHVSVVIRGDDTEEHQKLFTSLYPDDYKQYRTTLALFEAVPKRGVTLFPLQARLTRTVDTIRHVSLRRHSGIIDQHHYTQFLTSFLPLVSGRPLETLTSDMSRALCLHLCGCQGNTQENWEKFYCSELVAESLQQLRILREGGLNSNNLVPDSFAVGRKASQCFTYEANDNTSITLSGHSYGPQIEFLTKGNALFRALQEEKAEMKRKYKQEQQQQKQSAEK